MSKKKPKTADSWQDFGVGGVVSTAGNAAAYKTGEWRSQRPKWNKERCIKCGICYIFCPEGCISQEEEGFFEGDPYYCKGCGICAKECWTQAITMNEEG